MRPNWFLCQYCAMAPAASPETMPYPIPMRPRATAAVAGVGIRLRISGAR